MKVWDAAERAARTSDPQGLALRTLDAVLAFSGGRAAAMFQREQEQILLFASLGLEQGALEAVEKAWESHKARFLAKEPLLVRVGEQARAILPVDDGRNLIGLLYVEGAGPLQQRDLQALAQFARIGSMAFLLPPAATPIFEAATEPVDAYLARTSPEDVDRQQLLALLHRHEWNLARVARLLAVTRATVYNRLSRYGIRRERVPKTKPRRQEA
ncbi:MAG TPA: helix-turn-helix domain-containing protein [Vicinamibacteria bacterium]